jgi:hypothetical protein
MKNCQGCKFAKWDRTDSGRLHPSGDGRCTYEWKSPPIPACSHWMGHEPKPYGVHINRRQDNKEHCVYYQREVMGK